MCGRLVMVLMIVRAMLVDVVMPSKKGRGGAMALSIWIPKTTPFTLAVPEPQPQIAHIKRSPYLLRATPDRQGRATGRHSGSIRSVNPESQGRRTPGKQHAQEYPLRHRGASRTYVETKAQGVREHPRQLPDLDPYAHYPRTCGMFDAGIDEGRGDAEFMHALFHHRGIG